MAGEGDTDLRQSLYAFLHLQGTESILCQQATMAALYTETGFLLFRPSDSGSNTLADLALHLLITLHGFIIDDDLPVLTTGVMALVRCAGKTVIICRFHVIHKSAPLLLPGPSQLG